ncbi:MULTISPECIES: hypothetical protein [unclassified Gordonia (in: high G+C Gram-positive bacteria)]
MGSPGGPRADGDAAVPEGPRPNGPRDDYRTPLLPGNYPPLGYSANGMPRYTPADLHPTAADGRRSGIGGVGLATAPPAALSTTAATGTPAAGYGGRAAVGAPDATSSRPAGGTPGRPRRFLGMEPGVGITVGAVVVVGVVLIGLVIVGIGSLRQPTPTVTLPPATITDDQTIPTLPTEPSLPGTAEPSVPRGGGTVPVGAAVTYTVTIDGSGTILYVDDVGVRTEFAPPPTWTVSFEAGRNPLRLLVVAGRGSSAQCSITVDGEQVVTDSVDAQSTRRTASCLA